MCGCCLEVCPNFMADRNFAGAAGMVQAYKTLEQSMRDGHYDEMADAYRTHFFKGCGQSLSCMDICPAGLPLDDIQARANAYAVWKK